MLVTLAVDALAQAAAAPTVQLDVGKLVLVAVGTLLSALGTAVIFFVQRLIASFDGFKKEIGEKVDKVQQDLQSHSSRVTGELGEITGQMQRVTQEMFGPNGTNGMRGDLRQTTALVRKHDRLLGRLADRAGVTFEEG